MIDAAFLAGLDYKTRTLGDDSKEPQINVVDIGGTTTDVCALSSSGFPR
jgi:N-methylhydantoinase A/oxoprolinase/acetone carboxylase beta subunit